MYRKVMVDILEKRKIDESVFPLLFCLDEGDDWQDKKITMVWLRKSCYNCGSKEKLHTEGWVVNENTPSDNKWDIFIIRRNKRNHFFEK
jgi:hypothetical protein